MGTSAGNSSRLMRAGVFECTVFLLGAIALLAGSSWLAAAQDRPAFPAGEWRGAIDLSVGEMVLDVTLRREGESGWSGIVNIPEQDITDAAMRVIEVADDSLSFEIYTNFGPYRFRGTLDHARNAIRGSVSSGQYSRPFALAPRDSIREVRYPELTPKKVDGLPSERSAAAAPEHPAVEYATRATSDPVARLNARLNATPILSFAASSGYLESVLRALNVSSASQIVVFSKTSVQAPRISPENPRALYFGDDVIVGYIRGAPFIEVAALDPKQGAVFYSLDQREVPAPRFARRMTCLSCHLSRNTMDVPGFLVRSVVADDRGRAYDQFGSFNPDHRTSFAQRWGGWYVTGSSSMKHLGNAVLVDRNAPEKFFEHETKVLADLHSVFDTNGYPTAQSDMAALLVFEHQMHMANLIVRLGWDARAALSAGGDAATKAELTKRLLANDARELVDYLLFVDEEPLSGAIKTSSEFAARFSTSGRRDPKGRSLRDLDLSKRLLRYPCSYMIYSEAFDALPIEARNAVYERMWAVLSGKARERNYERLSRGDRRNIVEILRATKPDLPSYFRL